MSETGGSLRRIYVSLLTVRKMRRIRGRRQGLCSPWTFPAQGGRGEGDAVDQARAAADAKALFEAGEKAWGTDESEFNRVFATSSPAHIRGAVLERGMDESMAESHRYAPATSSPSPCSAVCEEYRKLSSYDLVAAIRKEVQRTKGADEIGGRGSQYSFSLP